MKKRKLLLNDIVRAKFLGGVELCTVVQIEDTKTYKLKTSNGIFLPGAKWKRDADKKAPWYIIEYIGKTTKVRSSIRKNDK